MAECAIREIECKTALSPSRLPGLDYALNPYRGCENACVYCYAPSIIHEERPWGEFIDAKVNIHHALRRELKTKKPGVVGIGTVTDPYTRAEEKYFLTRKCLVELLDRKFPACIQTKSALVLRDSDLIGKFPRAEVGFTVTTLDDSLRQKYEGGSPVGERLGAMKALSGGGIRVWGFIGPILPGITDAGGGFGVLVQALASSGAQYIMADRLRLKAGTLRAMDAFLRREMPSLAPRYGEIFSRGGDAAYYSRAYGEIEATCRRLGVEFKRAF